MSENKEMEQIIQVNLMEKLSSIQNEMNVPKNLYNKHSNFYYRSAETILECAKPICRNNRTVLTIQDELEVYDGWHYVKAIVTLHDLDSDDYITNVAYAREQLDRKGMDYSQITGATSSYARKYALNGLFNLDDVKDADGQDNTDWQDNANGSNKIESIKEVSDIKITEKQMALIKKLYTNEQIEEMESRKGKLEDWSVKLASQAIEAKKEKNNG